MVNAPFVLRSGRSIGSWLQSDKGLLSPRTANTDISAVDIPAALISPCQWVPWAPRRLQVKELAYTQIGITCDGAAAINDGVDAIARNTNRASWFWLMSIAFRNSSLRISTGWGLRSCAL